MVNLPDNKQVFEVFEELELQTTKAKLKSVLEKYRNMPALRDVLRGMFDDTLVFLLPEGKPPYTPNRPESTPSTLLRRHRDFGWYVKGGPGKDLTPFKREKMFIELLESVHPGDALLILAMVNKKSPIKGLNKQLVQEVFPNLIKDGE